MAPGVDFKCGFHKLIMVDHFFFFYSQRLFLDSTCQLMTDLSVQVSDYYFSSLPVAKFPQEVACRKSVPTLKRL